MIANARHDREKLAYFYSSALERGDLATVAAVLADAEDDPLLAGILAGITAVYAEELGLPAARPGPDARSAREYDIIRTGPGADGQGAHVEQERRIVALSSARAAGSGAVGQAIGPLEGKMRILSIHLFGGLVLERDRQPIAAPTPQKAALLLAYLLTAYNRSHPRSLLAGLFWGDLAEQRAKRNLSDALWRIRNLLDTGGESGDRSKTAEQPLLLTEGDSVRLNPDAPLDLDVREFERLLGDPDDLAAQERAVALYRGDLLVGYYDDWVLLERERLRQAYLLCLTRMVPAYKARHAWEPALQAAEKLVAADPYQEEATREVMRLNYRLGRRDKALRQFAALKATLEAELSLEPEPETVALYQLMQAGQALGSADDLALGPAGIGRATPVALPVSRGAAATQTMSTLRSNLRSVALVGRQSELAVLTEWLGAPRPGAPLMVILGEAGVGKSRLVQDAVEEAYRHRMFVLTGHYHPLGAPLPYGGLIEALRMGLQLGGPPTLEPIWLSEVSRLLPELSMLFPGLAPPLSLPSDQERTRLWEALTRYLLALAASGPHMFVLEDVQWVDPATLDLLQYALPRLLSSEAGLRLLATARSEDLADTPGPSSALRGLEGQGLLTYLRLECLGVEAIGELVQQALGMTTPAPRFSQHLWQETEGNPFFALETIRFWTEQRALTQRSDGSWDTPGVRDYAKLPTAASVKRVLEQRLARLSPAARAVIEVGAVLGREVPERLLWRSSGTTLEAILGPAEELLRHQLWVEAPSGQGYQFAHSKVVEVAYEGISGARRRHLHRLAATALESEQPEAVEQLAHHWLAADDRARALPYLQQAAERAESTFAHEEALAFYDQAVLALDKLPAADLAATFDLAYQILAGRGALRGLMQQMAQAQGDLDRLVEMARQANQAGRVADALHRRSAHLRAQARYTEALSDLQEALELATSHQNAIAKARILKQQLQLFGLYQGDWAAAIRVGEDALAGFRELGNLLEELNTLAILGTVYGFKGERDHGIALLEEALEKVRRIPNSARLEAGILNNLSMFVPSPQTAYNLLRRSLEIAEQTRMAHIQGATLQNLAQVAARFGQPAKALEYAQRAYDVTQSAGNKHLRGWMLMARGRARASLGDSAAARADLREAVQLFNSVGARAETVTAYLNLGEYLVDQGEFDSGLSNLERSYVLWHELGEAEGASEDAVYQAELARAYMGLRRNGAARRAVEKARARVAEARQRPTVWINSSVQVLAHCYSVLAALGRRAEADEVLEQGYALMMETADLCGPELRASYLEGMRECRVLRAAWQHRQAARDNGEGGAGESAPPEAAGKVAQRRAELRIMLHDAAKRGEVLNEEELARHFDVSKRTIQRDLAALLRSGAGQ